MFPAGASNLSAVNDFPAGTSFASIDIQGASVELTGNLTASMNSGLAIDSLATKLDSGIVNIAPGGQIFAMGVFSGAAGLELTGGGTLAMIGSAANTYTGTTTVDYGTLNLENTTSDYAVPGNLVIGGSGQGTVFESNSDQINPTGTMTVNTNGLLNLQGQNETIGGLDLVGNAQVYTGLANAISAGVLTLNGDVTVDGTNGTPAITGTLDLGPANRTFTVSAGTVNLYGVVQGTHALIKAGAGILTLNSNVTYNDPAAVNINAGTMYFDNGNTIDESSTAGITVSSGATMWTVNVGTVSVPVSLIGSGVSGVGALHNMSYGDNLTDVILAGNVSIGADYSNPGLTISSALTDGGSAYSLTKVGNGILILSGTNTYTGGTTVSAGELYVSGSITGAVQTTTSGELGGSGTVGNATTNGGTVGAGQTANWDPQIENYASLTFDSTATFSAQVLGSSPGPGGYDQVVVSGAVALNSATLRLSTYGLPSNVVTMDLIKGATSLTGTFNGLAEGGVVTISGCDFKFTYAGGTGGHDVVLNRVVPTTTSVAIPTNSSVFSQPDTFTATVTTTQGNTPTGTVTFYSGTTKLGTGTLSGNSATVTTGILPVGSDPITAVYNGDTNDLTSNSNSTPVTQIVIQDNSASSVTTSAATTVFGQSVTFTASLPGAGVPTGTVDFYDGTTQVGTANLTAGVATFSTTNIPRGSQILTAQFEGSGDFLSSYSPPIGQIVTESSTQTVLSGGGAMVLGLPALITATVLPVAPATAIPTGFVLFEDGSVPIATVPLDAHGVAQLSTASLSVGAHAITAIYGGNAGYTISTTTSSVSVSVTPDLTGMVYLDLRSNNVPAVSGSVSAGPGLGGQLVFLDLHHNGNLDPGDPTAITDANGVFQFPGYAPGSAPVLVQTTMGAGGHFSVAHTGLDATGNVVIGVVPTSAVTPVPISPAPGSSATTSPRESFVQSLYHDVLGRAATATEEAHWVRQIIHGVTRREVAHAIFNSREHRQQEVAAYSEAFLGTSPLAGSGRLVSRLRQGGSEQEVVRSILNSPAYQSAHTNPSMLVQDLYLEVLGQQPTSSEVAGWTSLLRAGLSRRELVDRFVNSAAVDEQIVQSFYAIYLHSQPNAAEIRHATAILESQGGSATKLAVSILGSRGFDQAAQG